MCNHCDSRVIKNGNGRLYSCGMNMFFDVFDLFGSGDRGKGC